MNKNLNLLEGKILPVLLKLSAPLMGTAFVQITYVLADIIWVGRIGTEAVAASGTVGILIWFANALMLVPRVGLSIRGAHSYGAKDLESTKTIFRNGIQLAVIMGILLTLTTVIFKEGIIGYYGLADEVDRMAKDYLLVISFGFVLSFLNPVLSACYNSMGNSITPFRMNVIGLILNIALDPILIFGIGPIPGMGIVGAAMATVFSQLIVSILFIIIIKKSRDLIYRAGFFKQINISEMKKIIKLGLPGFLQSGVHSVAGMILNKYMAFYGAIPVAVYSVGSMIESVSWMTTDGISAAIAALVGQNYGAKREDRIKEAFRTSIVIVSILGILVTIAFYLFGDPIFRVFLPKDEEAIALGVKYLHIIGWSQVFMTVEIGSTGVFNGIGKPNIPGIIAVILNILRIPMAWIFMPIYGVLGVWISMSVSGILKGVFGFSILKGKIRKLKFD
ncbi:MAG: MATE family efflux transporter [Tissierellia bacterium]|nr:MATE family efflux transporter [Tissierellia bacterium]